MSLRAFIAAAWPVLEPATPFVPGWHIDAMAEHLEAVSRGEIRALVINVPPRHMKSLCVSVFWPVWSWTYRPSTRWLYASYALSLSIRDSLKCRRLIESAWFQERWGTVFRLAPDQNMKSRFDNDKSGYRIATSVGGAATGEGGDVIVADDPHKVAEVESDAMRTSVIDWWDGTMATRLNDPKRGAKVIVMQRTHTEDLAGHVLAQGGAELLALPAEYDPDTSRVTAIGWRDPRTLAGELLWAERMGRPELDGLRRQLGSYRYAGQFDQQPVPRGGGMFKRAWWRRYGALPELERVEIFVDSAFKTGVGNDPSALVAWGTDALGSYYVLDAWVERVEYPELLLAVHGFHQKHAHRAPVVPVVVEDKASGQSAIQTLSRPLPTLSGTALPALPVIAFPVNAGESKIARAQGVTPLVEAGRVFLPLDAPWVEDFIVEHERFPNAAHDDQVDTTSMALARLPTPPALSVFAATRARGW